MPLRAEDASRASERIEYLRRSIARYRCYLNEGASRKLAAAYLQATNEAEAEIAGLEDSLRVPGLPEDTPGAEMNLLDSLRCRSGGMSVASLPLEI